MNTVYLLVGAPGSGKTTYGKTLAEKPNTVRLCPDEFRAKFGWGEGDQSVSAIAFEATKRAMGDALDAGKDVVIDATNMYKKSRKDFINIARGRGATITAVVFELSRETLIKRVAKRVDDGGRNVLNDVIDRMLGRYERPDELEVDKVEFVCKL